LRLIHGTLFSRESRLRVKWLPVVLVSSRLALSTLETKLPSGLFTACLPAWRLMEGGVRIRADPSQRLPDLAENVQAAEVV
jgi:hypothetical protein